MLPTISIVVNSDIVALKHNDAAKAEDSDEIVSVSYINPIWVIRVPYSMTSVRETIKTLPRKWRGWNDADKTWEINIQGLTKLFEWLPDLRGLAPSELLTDLEAVENNSQFAVSTGVTQEEIDDFLDSGAALPSGWSYHQHQRDGISTLIKWGRGILGDQQGVGKTIQTIGVMKWFIERGKKFILILPVIVIPEWEKLMRQVEINYTCVYNNEFNFSSDVAIYTHFGARMPQIEYLIRNPSTKKSEYYNPSYRCWSNNFPQVIDQSWLKALPKKEQAAALAEVQDKKSRPCYGIANTWRIVDPTSGHVLADNQGCQYMLVADEAHLLSTSSSDRGKAFRNMARQISAVNGSFLLTGTAMRNGKIEALYNLLDALDHPISKVFWGKYGRYERGKYSVTPHIIENMIPELHKELKETAMVRRLMIDVRGEGAPSSIGLVVPVTLTPSQGTEMRMRVADAISDYKKRVSQGKANKKGVALSLLTNLRIAASVAKLPHTAHIAAERIADGEKRIVVFAVFKETVAALKKQIKSQCKEQGEKVKVLIIDGAASQAKREQIVSQFASDDDENIVIIGSDAAKVGVNLQAARTLIMHDTFWTSDDNDQALFRINRIDQDKDMVYIIVVADAIDGAICEIAWRNQTTAAKVLDNNSSPLSMSFDVKASFEPLDPAIAKVISEALINKQAPSDVETTTVQDRTDNSDSTISEILQAWM